MPQGCHAVARACTRRLRVPALPAALALAFGALPPALHAQAPVPTVSAEPDAASFASEYEAATRLMTSRSWKAAHAAWLELLRRHAGQDHVRAKVEEIRAGLRKCAFWQVTKEPDPKKLVKGALRTFAPSSGRIELYYSAELLGDFERQENGSTSPWRSAPTLYVHPLTFRGSYSLTLAGTAEEIARATLYVALEHGKGYAVQIGAPGEVTFVYHQILRLDGGEPRVVERVTPAAPAKKKPGKPKPIQAVVKVDSKAITFSYDGRAVARVENEDKTLGRFGLAVNGEFGVLEVSGTVEPSWIDGLQDAFVQSARESFEKSYVDPPELAPWTDGRSASTVEERMRRLREVPLPGQFLPGQVTLIEEVRALRRNGRAREAVTRLDALRGLLPEDARMLLLALSEVEAQRPARALERLDDYDDLVGLSTNLRFLQAHLLGTVERESEAIEVLNRLAAEDATEPLVPHELTQHLIATGRFEEARATLERGAAASQPLTEFAELRAQLVKATLGPDWKQSFKQSSERFAVASDLDNESCRAAVRELDEALVKCGEWFGALAAPPAPTKVYLFSGKATYEGYVRGISNEGLANTLGAYSVGLDQIMAWNSSDREQLLRTLRHECVHRYLDLALGKVPPWLDEGLAEYLVASKVSARKWVEGAPNEPALIVLGDGAVPLAPLDTFLRLDPGAFMQRAQAHYPQAWAFVHFLRRGNDPQASALLARLWKALAEPTDALSAVEHALEGVDIAALEQRFSAHLETLLHPPVGAKPR